MKRLIILAGVLAVVLITLGAIVQAKSNSSSSQGSAQPTESPETTNFPEQSINSEELDSLVKEKKLQYSNSLQDVFKKYLTQMYDNTYITDENGKITNEESKKSILLSEIANNQNADFDMSMFHTDEVDCSEENSYGTIYFHTDGTKTYEVSLKCILTIKGNQYNLD